MLGTAPSHYVFLTPPIQFLHSLDIAILYTVVPDGMCFVVFSSFALFTTFRVRHIAPLVIGF
jgi:hypothetical protein